MTDGTLWTPADQLAAGHCALVVIDLQNDFTHPEGFLAQRRGVDVTPVRQRFDRVAGLVAGARGVGVPVIWLSVIHDSATEPGNYLAAHLRGVPPRGAVTPGDLLTHRGTWGSAWDSALPARRDGEAMLEKPGYNGFHDTDLATTLQRLGTRTMVFAGCNTNVCIQATAMAGFARGYYTVLAEDACASLDGEAAHAAALATHRRYYGPVLKVAEILDHWAHRTARADSSPAIP